LTGYVFLRYILTRNQIVNFLKDKYKKEITKKPSPPLLLSDSGDGYKTPPITSLQ